MGKDRVSLSIDGQVLDVARIEIDNLSAEVEEHLRNKVNIASFNIQQLQDELDSVKAEKRRRNQNIREEERELDKLEQREDVIQQRIAAMEKEQERREAVDDTEFWQKTIENLQERTSPSKRSQLIEARHKLYKNRYLNIPFNEFYQELSEQIDQAGLDPDEVIPAAAAT